MSSKRALQIAVALGGLVPVGAGLGGVLLGPHLLKVAADPTLDSHFRYLSGLLLGLGLLFWGSIPRIETKAALFRALTFVVVVGGLARAYGLLQTGLPDMSMRLALVMELGVTPLLCLWQNRLARSMDAGRLGR